jgi:hypothetical protein
MWHRVFGRLAVCCMGLAAWLSATASPSPTAAPSAASLCAFDWGPNDSDAPCTPYTRVKSFVIATFSASVFGGSLAYDDRRLAALDNGTVMVAAGRGGLYAIDRSNRVVAIWKPSENNYGAGDPVVLLTPFKGGVVVLVSHLVLGVRGDGAIVFRQRLNEPSGSNPARVRGFEDRDGTIWIQDRNDSARAGFAYIPAAHRIERIPEKFVAGELIGGSDRYAYEDTPDGLFLLRSRPRLSMRLMHPPIAVPRPQPSQFGVDSQNRFASTRGVGADGSLWATTLTQVIHVHPDGFVRVIRLARPITAFRSSVGSMELTTEPDGSAWAGYGAIRITKDDRVQAVELPRHDTWSHPVFSPDGSAWTVMPRIGDTRSDSEDTVLHFQLAPAANSTVVVTKEAPPSRFAITLTPDILPSGDPGLRGVLRAFLPLIGEPWHCTSNTTRTAEVPKYPEAFTMWFVAEQGDALRRGVRGQHFYLYTTYEGDETQHKIRGYTNDGGTGQFKGFEEQLFSDGDLNFSGVRRNRNRGVDSITERYVLQSRNTFAIYSTSTADGSTGDNIFCSRQDKEPRP